MTRTPEETDAIDRIRAIARAHGFSADEVAAAIREAETGDPQRAGLLGRILAILGGIFVFSGIAVFIGLNWESMNTAARIVVTLGSGVATFILALIADHDERYQRAATPLFFVAAALQPTGLLVTIDEFFSGGDWHFAAMFVAGVMALQQGLVFRSRGRAVCLFTTILFSLWFLATLFDYVGIDGEFAAIVLGGSTVGLSVGLSKTRYAEVVPFWYLAGSIAFYSGLHSILDDTVIELLFLAVASAGIFLSAVVASRMLLGVSTIAMLGYIAEFTAENFAESLGWPIVLILIGLALIGLSGLALRINRKYIASD